ncbi:MAG TPA: alginate export family protein [Candidatus Xenobia bacterium]|nr:alginate export family protein [Candidatus Xenobia bacterium]
MRKTQAQFCRWPLCSLALLGLALGLPGLVGAEGPQAGGGAKKAETKQSKPPKRVEVGVEIRLRGEFRDNNDFKPTDDFDAFLGQRVRAHLRFRVHPDLTLFVQVQDVWLYGAESDKIVHSLGTNLYQLYLDWKPAGSERLELRAGRHELIYGEERLVGAFGWDNVGRSFDGARLRYRAGFWSTDFFGARLVDVRRAGAQHRVGNQDLYGIYSTRTRKDSPDRTELYALFLHDGLRTKGESSAGSIEPTDILTVGFRHLRQPKTGWRYSVEHAWQFGGRGPDGHRAAMLVATGGYQWGGRWQPRLQFEYDFATGDNNRSDGHSGEFNNLFPTNHTFYGYADLVGLRNMHDFRLTAAVRLHAKLTFEADYHRFLLATPRGPWKNAGGRVLGFDPTGAAGRDLGQEIDFTLRAPVTTHLSFLGGYSLFLPGRFAVTTRGPEPNHFGYIQTTIRF